MHACTRNDREKKNVMQDQDTFLHSLLAATKLGWQRRDVSLWLRRSLLRRVIQPAALTNHYGEKTGLTNQLFALVGCAVLANLSGASLVLPPLTDERGANKFGSIFDREHFIDAIRGSLTVFPDQNSALSTKSGLNLLRLDPERGWLIYKGIYQAFPQTDPGLLAAQSVERAVYSALVPSPRLLSLSHSLAARLFGVSGDQASPYGCIHTRLERDMLKIARFNNAGDLPTLSDYLSPTLAARFPNLTNVSRAFVSVGADIRLGDQRRLQRPTSWNASLHTTKFEREFGRAATAHLDAALIDSSICRNASWFIGWPGSTFARLHGFYREIDYHQGYFAVCPHEMACHLTPRDIGRHSFCRDVFLNAQNVSREMTSYLRKSSAKCIM